MSSNETWMSFEDFFAAVDPCKNCGGTGSSGGSMCNLCWGSKVGDVCNKDALRRVYDRLVATGANIAGAVSGLSVDARLPSPEQWESCIGSELRVGDVARLAGANQDQDTWWDIRQNARGKLMRESIRGGDYQIIPNDLFLRLVRPDVGGAPGGTEEQWMRKYIALAEALGMAQVQEGRCAALAAHDEIVAQAQAATLALAEVADLRLLTEAEPSELSAVASALNTLLGQVTDILCRDTFVDVGHDIESHPDTLSSCYRKACAIIHDATKLIGDFHLAAIDAEPDSAEASE